MRTRRQLAELRAALSRHWCVRPALLTREDLAAQLELRPLEERRVLSAGAALALAQALAASGMEQVEGTTKSPDPATPLGTDAAQQQPIDPGGREVPGQPAHMRDQPKDPKGPAASNLTESDNRSVTDASDVQTQAQASPAVDAAPEQLTLTVVGNQNVAEGGNLAITDIGTFSDPGFDETVYTYSIDWGDGTAVVTGAATIDFYGGDGLPTQGSFDGAHVYADNGSYTVTVTITSEQAGSASGQFSVSVQNVAPTLSVVSDQVTNEGTLLSINDLGTFTDPGFDNPLNVGGEVSEKFTYAIDWGDGTAVSSGPGTIDVAGSPGVLTQGSFNGSHIYADNGVYTVTVTLNDDDGGSAAQTFTVRVNNVAPTLTVAPNQSVNEGSLLTITNIGQIEDPGFDNPLNVGGEVSEKFTYAIDWGDGTPVNSGPVTIDVPGSPGVPTQGSFDGSHTYADNGIYTVTATVNDDDGGSAAQTFTVVVHNVAPILTVAPNQVVNEGSLLAVANIGQFTDPGFNNPLNVGGEVSEKFTYAINWGDGTPLNSGPPTIDVPGSPGVPTQGSFDGSHTYADNGVYTVTVTVSDDDGGVAQQTFNVTVNNVAPTLAVAPNQVVNEGSLLSVPNIGQFTDPGFNNPLNVGGEVSETFTYAINWGDGTPTNSGPATIDLFGKPGMPTQGSFDGSHIYADNGVYTVTVTISDDDGGTTSQTFEVTVNNVAPTLIVPGDQVVDEGDLLSLPNIGQFTDPGFDNPLNVGGELTERFTYAIDWGDGSPVNSGPAPINVPGGPGVLTAGSFSGAHTYAAAGYYTVTVTVNDDDGGSSVGTFMVTVRSVAPILITAPNQLTNEGSLLSVDKIGQFTDPRIGGAASYTYSINWGDGNPVDSGPATVNPGGGEEGIVTGSFNGAHTYADNGLYTVVVTIVTSDGRSASQALHVQVNNVAPTLVVGPNQIVPLGQLLQLPGVGKFSDPGFDNPLNVGGEVTERFTFSISWQDGTPLTAGPATITSPGSPGVLTSGSFNAQHLFASTGTFTVKVSLADDDGGVAVGTFQVTVFVLRPPPQALFLPPGGGGGGQPPPPVPVGGIDPRAAPPSPLSRIDFRGARIASVAGAEPRLVLRVVTPGGLEERSRDEPLPDELLNNLRALFNRLPDGHYRIYQIQPDGIERLVVDVLVHEGRSIQLDPEAMPVDGPPVEDGAQLDSPPRAIPTADDATSEIARAVTTKPEAPTEPTNEEHRSAAAIPLGIAGAALTAPRLRLRRLRRQLPEDESRRLTKLHRILRRER